MTRALRCRLVAVIILGTSGLAISAEVAASGNVQPATALRIRSWVDDNVEKPLEPFELVPGKPASDWAFTLEPYGWLPAFDSNLSIKGFPAIGFRLSPIQVLQKLDWGIFMAGEARKGRWGVLADGMYAQFSAEGTTQGSLYQSSSVQFQQSIMSLALAFRVIDNKSGYLDLYAGGRAYYLGVDCSAQTDSAGIQRIAEASTDRIASSLSQRASELIKENAGIAADALADRLKSEISTLDPNLPATREYLNALAQAKAAQAAEGSLSQAELRKRSSPSPRRSTAPSNCQKPMVDRPYHRPAGTMELYALALSEYPSRCRWLWRWLATRMVCPICRRG